VKPLFQGINQEKIPPSTRPLNGAALRADQPAHKEKKMSKKIIGLLLLFPALFLWAGAGPTMANIVLQCPYPIVDPVAGTTTNPNVICLHLAAGDGFAMMTDGYPLYTFGFSQVPMNILPSDVMAYAMFKAQLPAPTITIKEGQELYLNLTNVGMSGRPDLFDAHTVHFHGFPNAATYYDGEPMASLGINMGSTFTYYYKVLDPGTYMYHCHIEATEHMQMGMLGNLYVTPAQNDLPNGTNLNGFTHLTGYKYAYNDGDGSTFYQVEYPILIQAFDPAFHDADRNIQPLDFAGLEDKYGILNGRGYPDTVNTTANFPLNENGDWVQKIHSRITALSGQKILLRIANLSFDFYTLTVQGIPLRVVGKDAKLRRGPTGLNLAYTTSAIDLGGGQSADVILDTTGIAPGTYPLFTTNLNYLSNNAQDFGGMMTEIIIN
jgi:FtsP/CotA-like multicopper oxidase with cupredoxin domain